MKIFANFYSDEHVSKEYEKSAVSFANAVNYLIYGRCVGFEKRLKKWGSWELEYAKRGFKPISLDNFCLVSRGKEEFSSLESKLAENEKPVYHAIIYKKFILGKEYENFSAQRIEGTDMVTGQMLLPSTEKYVKSQ